VALTWQEAAIPALETALEKTTGLGARIDLVLAMVRMGLFSADTQLVTSNITRASEWVSKTVPLAVCADS
jgi:26S proteasome regulatory subunit N7